jgi:hypothetical protein
MVTFFVVAGVQSLQFPDCKMEKWPFDTRTQSYSVYPILHYVLVRKSYKDVQNLFQICDKWIQQNFYL